MVNSYGDCIYLRNLHLSAIVGKDAWQRRSKPQPLTISLKLYSDVATAGQSDDIDLTTSYGQICKDIQTFIDTQKDFDNLRHLNYELVFLAVKKDWGGNALHIISTVPKGLLRSEGGLTFELITGCPPSDLVKYAPAFNCVPEEIWSVKDLKLACIIGVNAHERLKRQIVVVSLKFTLRDSFIEDGGGLAWFEGQWEELVDRVTKSIEESSYETLEALATQTVKIMCENYYLKRATVSVEKPSALAFVDGAGVEVTRTYDLETRTLS